MTNQLTTATAAAVATAAADHPRDAETGLILPLSKSLDSRELVKHRAHIAVELEVLARKLDRFGWDRDRGSVSHDRQITDWMDALQEYPLSEVKGACRRWIEANPNAKSMPHEGTIKSLILKARHDELTLRRANASQSVDAPSPPSEPRVTSEQRAAILAEKGFTKIPSFQPKSMPRAPKTPASHLNGEVE